MKIPNNALWFSAIPGFMLLEVAISWGMNRDIVSMHHLIIIPNIFNHNFFSISYLCIPELLFRYVLLSNTIHYLFSLVF